MERMNCYRVRAGTEKEESHLFFSSHIISSPLKLEGVNLGCQMELERKR